MQVKPSPLSRPILFTKTLFFTSCLPLLVGLLCEGAIYLTGSVNTSFLLDQNEYQNSQENFFVLFIRQAKDVSYGTYSNFIQFMVTMLGIHLLGYLIQILKFKTANDALLLVPNGDQKSSDEASKFKKINSAALNFFGYVLAYCAIYYIRSIIGTHIEGASSLQSLEHFRLLESEDLTQDIERIESSSRILEEISNDNQALKAIQTETKKNLTTFPLGRVLGSLNIEGSDVVFSKDETVLYVARTNFFGITQVDISNWENPRVIQSYKGIIQKPGLQHVSLLLSPDGKTLFASNMVYFAQFGLGDSNAAPNYQTSVIQQFPTDVNTSVQTSLALSPDGTKLFVSGYGFQVFDVSKIPQAKLIKYELPAKEFHLSSVAVSSDGQSLFLINGTRLNIYNITDINNTNIISSVGTENTPCSFIQSKDKRILTTIGFQKGTNKVVIERVDMSDITAPSLLKTFPLNVESSSSLFGLSQSPKETYLYFTVKEKTSGAKKMMVFDVLNERLLEDSQNLISKASSLRVAPNEKSLIVIFEEYIATFQLYRSFPNDRFFTVTKNALAQISTAPKSSNQILKLFSSILLSVDQMDDSAGSRFTFTDISNQTLPVEIRSFSAGNNPVSVSIINDAKMLFASFKKKLMIYDISDLKSINTLGSFAVDESHDLLDAVFTSDGKTCYAVISETHKGGKDFEGYLSFLVKVFDLSDPASIKETGSFSDLLFYKSSPNVFLILSKDEKTIFVVERFLYTFDISAGTIKRNFNKAIDGLDFVSSSVSLSPNEKILAIRKEDPVSSSLILVDVRNMSSPTLFSSFALPKAKTIKNIPVVFSPDSQQVYAEGIHDGKPSLLVFDISNPSSPIFQNAINVEGFTEGSVDNFIVSDDGLSAYLASDLRNKIYVGNLVISNTVFLGTENFRLGEKSTTDVMVLSQKSQGDYVPLSAKSKFVKASLFSTKINPSESFTNSTFTPFPYWMTFLKESGNFVVEPKKQRDLGTYTFYSAFSMQLNLSSFNRIETLNTTNEAVIQALLATLISLGYLDSDLYVTGNLGAIDRFFLTTPYIDYKAAIYQILKENYFESFTIFDVVPSLDIITSKKKLEISTPSDNSLKIEILFTPGWETIKFQFLNKQYGPLVPLITDNKAKLSMEGSVDDINSALKKLVMDSNVNSGIIDCGGMITIWDHLNPSINQTFKNLSGYFEANEVPRINGKAGFDVQEQIDAGLIYTGEYFAINFLNKTFIDKYSESLSFTLTLDNKERSPAPSWLLFSDSGLKGTAPEEFLNRKVNLIMTVKNEFKKIEVPITLNIRLSAAFLLKLFIRYSPYLLTALGLWVFANRIYNVVGKDKYRHEKEFYISVGQEITSQDIYPISFLGQEGEESSLIWKNLKKDVLSSKDEIIQEIDKVVQKLPEKSLPLYKKGSALSKKLINQLILNNLALWLIDLREEKETKKIYEEHIEEHLMDLVKWDDDDGAGYCQIIESKLTEILKKTLNREGQQEEGMEVGLISQRTINIDLLKDVIIAEAMRCQSIRTRALFTHLIIKEEVPGNWIKRFLKLNLWDLQSAQKGQKMVYGIDYEIKNDVLCFSGIAEEKFCGRTIALQITDLRHKILKEVWIHGVNEKGEEEQRRSTESEVQGKNYEIL